MFNNNANNNNDIYICSFPTTYFPNKINLHVNPIIFSTFLPHYLKTHYYKNIFSKMELKQILDFSSYFQFSSNYQHYFNFTFQYSLLFNTFTLYLFIVRAMHGICYFLDIFSVSNDKLT